MQLGSVDDVLKQFGGDHRKAEVACWDAWEREGKPQHSTYAAVAVAIANDYHYPSHRSS